MIGEIAPLCSNVPLAGLLRIWSTPPLGLRDAAWRDRVVLQLFFLRLSQQPPLLRDLLALGEATVQHRSVLAHEKRELVVLLDHVHYPIAEAGVLHAAIVIELLPRLRHGGLIRAAGHAHPPGQSPKFIHHIEALASTVHLKHNAGPTLRRSDGPGVQRKPVNLVLETSCDTAMHLRAHPDMPLGPLRKVPQLLDLRMVLQGRVPHR
mmetsp:Transcript_8755/g.20830  ORF Transcript_8755/g.20830 Transcript_8755/m.20830 type:complete len:207 (-) Transcript_8755:444-1064(-)